MTTTYCSLRYDALWLLWWRRFTLTRCGSPIVFRHELYETLTFAVQGQEIRAGVIRYFEQGYGRNRLVTREDVKIIVVLEAALLNLGRCIDLVKPAGEVLLPLVAPAGEV